MKGELSRLRRCNSSHESFLLSLEYFFCVQVAQDKEKKADTRRAKRQAKFVSQEYYTALEFGRKSTPDLRKLEKRARTSRKEEEWVEVPAMKDFRKSKPKPETKKSERPKLARFKAVIIKSAEGISYAAILKNLKSHVNSEELGATIRGIRETRFKDLLFEVNCAAKDRGRLDSAFRGVIGESRSVPLLFTMVEVEILDIDPPTEVPEIQEALRSCLHEETTSELMVTMTKRPSKGTSKAFIKLEKSRALKLLKVTHIKIWWVSCRVRRRTAARKCYRCLGFGHLAAQCAGIDRSKSY